MMKTEYPGYCVIVRIRQVNVIEQIVHAEKGVTGTYPRDPENVPFNHSSIKPSPNTVVAHYH